MEASQFTDHPKVRAAIASLESWRNEGIAISDVIDDGGHQYVDLVMEGGGVLGIALLGYTYGLEAAGIRFMHLGGASAGSITAMLLAATGSKDRPKSADLVTVLADQDLREFMDGGEGALKFTNALLARKGTFRILWQGRRVIDDLRDQHGLHPGTKFTAWIQKIIGERGIKTTRELEERVAFVPPGLRHRNNVAFAREARLALVTAEITTETKVEFPRMALLFWSNPQLVNPANYVRASMSVPFFFHPYQVDNLPHGPAVIDAWRDLGGYTGTLPDAALFMDGGIVSNFPIHVFHRTDRVPSRPTFGVKLGADRTAPRQARDLAQISGAIFSTARHALDYDFILRNPDYKHLVTAIPTDDHNWLNFNLSEADKVDLFMRGVECAAAFVTSFEWDKYKELRRSLIVPPDLA